MFQKVSEKVSKGAQFVRENYDDRCRKLSVGAGLMAIGPLAMAADPTTGTGDAIDVTSVLAKITAGAAAGLLVSIAMTTAILGLRASKLPRKG